MNEQRRIDPEHGLLPQPAPEERQAAQAEWRKARTAEHVEFYGGVAAVMGQALLALVAGAIAGGFAEPQYGLVVGAVALFAGLVIGYGVSNFVVLLFAPVIVAKLAKRVLARPGEQPHVDPNEGVVIYRLAVMAVNATLYVAVVVGAAVLAVANGAGFWRSLGCLAIAAFVTGLPTRRARRQVT